jgi:peptidyl-prolyl cis-trans isomerase SurA
MVMIKTPYVTLLGTLLSVVLLSSSPSKANTPLDKIAAVVNSDVVMLSEINTRARILRSTSKQAARLSPKQLQVEALDDLILERLQMQQAKQRGINIDPIRLNKTLEKIARQNKLSLGQFRQALQREGMNYDEYRKQVRNKLIMESLRKRQVDARINVSKQEIQDLIVSQSDKLNQGVQYKLQHILISAPNGIPIAQSNKAKKRAEQLRKEIIASGNFNAVAKSSSDNYAAKQGGNLGWQAAEKLPKSFNRVLSLLEVGAISEVVRDPKGFHILKLLEKRGGQKVKGGGLVTKARVQHILVKVGENHTNAQAKQSIDDIRKKLTQGASFSVLAKQYSEDLGSKNNGGNLGWVSEKALVPAFAKVMTQQKINSISTPFQTRFGWHILQVLERRQADTRTDSLKLKAQEFLGQRKLEEEYDAWLQRLKGEAYIEYRVSLGNGIRLK